MTSCKLGDEKIIVGFGWGAKLDVAQSEVFNVNSKIGAIKQTLFPGKHCSFFFDGLLLEDEATLVGLGIVDGDVIYVGPKGSFVKTSTDAFKTRVAKEISVGLNVLIGETEHGFDVIYSACAVDSFFSRIDNFIGQALSDPFFEMKTLPDLSSIFRSIEPDIYEIAVDVDNAYDEVCNAYISSLPADEKLDVIEFFKKVREKLNFGVNEDCDTECDERRHPFSMDMLYIGPARNSNFSNYLAYPPTVQLRGRKINMLTTLRDLLFSYQQYSEMKDLNLTCLSYDNTSFDLDRKVLDVLIASTDLGRGTCGKHFIYFPFDITKCEDSRRIDDLVEFIEGEEDIQPTETKKKRKKKRRSNQSESMAATAVINDTGATDNMVKDDDSKGEDLAMVMDEDSKSGDLAIVTEEDSKGEDLARNEIYGAISKNIQSELEAKHSKLNQLCKVKVDLERAIKEELEHIVVHNQNVEDIIDSKSAEMKNLILLIEKSEDEKNDRLKEVNNIDMEMSDLETKMVELNMKKNELLKASTYDDELIHKLDSKKHKLECFIERELKKAKEKGNSIETNTQNLEKKLSETVKAIENLPNEVLTIPIVPPVEPNRQLLDFIDNQISEKEKELECPVCLEVAGAPIFMCSELHLICSNCRPKVKECPECRIQYEGKPKRHRYAEKTAEELVRLKNQRTQVLES